MIFGRAVGDGEADRHLVEEGAFAEVIADRKMSSKLPAWLSLGESRG